MAIGKIKVNFKMPTPSAADRMHAKHQIIRKAAGLPDVDNNPDRPDAGKYSSGSSKPVKRVTPVATPNVNEEDITVVKKGSNIKKKISDVSYNVFKSHGFVKEGVSVGGMVGRGNVHDYDRNPGPKDGSELENVPFNAKTEKQKKLQNALNDLGKKMKETHPKLREAKDNREYGYEGDMAISQLKTVVRHAEHLMGMLKPDTDLPEWVQSKITLATDYLQTAHDYLASEMNEEVEQIDELSNNTLYSYVKRAAPQASARSKGINKALTKTMHNVMNKKNKPVKEDADPCWKGYKMVGMKDKNGRKVPNCVPGEGVPSMKKEGVQDDPKADQMTTDDNKFPKKSRKAAIVKSAAKKMPAEDQFQAKPVLDSQVAQQTNK